MIVAIIPARGGSKRIPRKNIKIFHGKPLIAYSIEVALESKLFDKIIVSTDDKEIADIAKEYGAEVPFMRDDNLSDDYSSSMDVFEDAISRINGVDFACMIYATAPLLQAQYLQEGFEKLHNSDAINAFSVTSMPFPIQRTFKINDDGRCEMFTPEYFSTRSQDLEEAYQDAGQFYWRRVGKKLEEIIFSKESIPIILPRHLVQDIDTLEDWRRAELMYKLQNQDIYDKWSTLKKELNKQTHMFYIKNTEIYFVSIGHNIGHESYGKDKLFLRPVIVYKKLSHTTFLGIPLSTKEKEGEYYLKFKYKKDKFSYASLNQIRVFDTKRIKYKSGSMKKDDFEKLKRQVKKFVDITPHSKRVGDA